MNIIVILWGKNHCYAEISLKKVSDKKGVGFEEAILWPFWGFFSLSRICIFSAINFYSSIWNIGKRGKNEKKKILPYLENVVWTQILIYRTNKTKHCNKCNFLLNNWEDKTRHYNKCNFLLINWKDKTKQCNKYNFLLNNWKDKTKQCNKCNFLLNNWELLKQFTN